MIIFLLSLSFFLFCVILGIISIDYNGKYYSVFGYITEKIKEVLKDG